MPIQKTRKDLACVSLSMRQAFIINAILISKNHYFRYNKLWGVGI